MLTFNFNKININPKGIMLDLGVEREGIFLEQWNNFPDLKCIGLDPHIESLDKASEGLEFLESISNHKNKFFKWFSIFIFHFNDNSFDLVVCSEVLEHLHEYKDALIEISRVLKPGGQFLSKCSSRVT